MKVLIHFKKSEIEKSMLDLNVLKSHFVKNKFGVERDLLELLSFLESFFKQVGDSVNESKISRLKIYIDTSIKGINPETLELVKSNKRKIVQASTFHCMSECSSILESELYEIEQLLKKSFSNISQLMLSVLQSRAVSLNQIKELENINQIEAFWNRLISSNDQIALINTKLKTELVSQDIVLVIDQVITQIK